MVWCRANDWSSSTGWHIRLSQTSRWQQNKSSVLAWPGRTWTCQNRTFVLMSTGGSAQPDVSPCKVLTLSAAGRLGAEEALHLSSASNHHRHSHLRRHRNRSTRNYLRDREFQLVKWEKISDLAAKWIQYNITRIVRAIRYQGHIVRHTIRFIVAWHTKWLIFPTENDVLSDKTCYPGTYYPGCTVITIGQRHRVLVRPHSSPHVTLFVLLVHSENSR